MPNRLLALTLSLLLCSGCGQPRQRAEPERPAPQEHKLTGADALALLDALAAEQRKVLDRFQTYEIEYSKRTERIYHPRPGTMDEDLRVNWGKGRFRAAHRMRDQGLNEQGQQDWQDVLWTTVGNEQYLANYYVGRIAGGPVGGADVADHTSLTDMSQGSRNRMSTYDLMKHFGGFGFGTGSEPFHELVAGYHAREKLDIEVSWKDREDKAPIYYVRVTDRALGVNPRDEYEVDAGRSYIVPRAVTYSPDYNWGRLKSVEVEAREIDPGLWFPSLTTGMRYAHDGSGNVRVLTTSIVKSVKPGVEPSDEERSLASLGIPPDCIVMHTDAQGRHGFAHVQRGLLKPGMPPSHEPGRGG